MKLQSKLIISIISLVLLSTPLNAQQIGIIAGLTVNKILETDKVFSPNPFISSTEHKYAPDFFLGLNSIHNLSNKSNLKIELLYFRRSSQYKDSSIPAYYLQNISVPLLYVYNVSEKLSIEAGPQGDYLLNKSIGVQKRLNFSGNIGLQFRYIPKVAIGIRYNHSLLTQVAKQYQSNYKLLNSTGIIYLQYLFIKK